MEEFHLQGWLCYDYDGLIAVKADKNASAYWGGKSIQESISDFFNSADYYDDESLGGRRDIIPNVSMRIYATNRECSLDEAIGSVVANLYGDIYSDIGYEGYSEWTITGYCCERFTIGGHDLAKEFETYIGKYIHLVLEIKQI